MSAELVLAEQVQYWVERVSPGDRLLAEAAVAKALASYAGGASVSEACQEARQLVGCRLRHPSSGSASPPKRLAVAC